MRAPRTAVAILATLSLCAATAGATAFAAPGDRLSSFGSDGVARIDAQTGAPFFWTDLALDGEGRIIGLSRTLKDGSSTLVRFTAGGAPDQGLDGGGLLRLPGGPWYDVLPRP